ncbi:hypothetical protein EBB07_18295 [Paenibacillaceae bacterium]|nr:hypothetical protein EBB07_18295 [Paenibacillaceae bacterium]
MSRNKLVVWSGVMLVMLLLVTACGTKHTNVDLGTVANGTYTNEYFGMSVNIPQEWIVQDDETVNELADLGKDLATDGDEKKKKQYDYSQLQTLNLLMISQFPLDEAVLNPSLIVNAEKVSKLQGIKTGEDYLNSAKKLLEQMGPYEFKDIKKETLGGKEFYLLEASIDNGETLVEQKYYSSIIKGYSFNMISTSMDEASAQEISKVLGSASFK